jgi:hypothetical protein
MAEPLDSIVRAFQGRRYAVSLHHWEQVVNDGRPPSSLVVAGIAHDQPEIIESYPDDPKGKSCLVLCAPPTDGPIHVVIGYEQEPMTLVTAYRPDSSVWHDDHRTRRRKRP